MTVTIIRCAILYIFVMIALRIMGKRQIGDLQPSELVITLLISEIAAIPLQDPTQPVLAGIAAIFTLVILEIFLSALLLKSQRVRTLVSGRAVVVIEDGKINRDAMERVRMTVLDLIELLRQNNVFDIREVAFAVLEVNGSLSVLLKPDFEYATRKDLKLSSTPAALPLPVICDGKIISDSLSAVGSNEQELEKILKRNGLKTEQVFILMLDRDKTVEIIRKR